MEMEKYQQLIWGLHQYILDELPVANMSDAELKEHIKAIVLDQSYGEDMLMDEKIRLVGDVYSCFRGFGILDSIMSDDSITEVMVNGYDSIFVEQSGRVRKVDITFENERKLMDVIRQIVGPTNREVNSSQPIVDTRLPDGSRVNVVLPPISLVGPVVTIRKFSKNPMTMEKLIKYGSLTPDVASFLKTLVQAKYNIFISGGTGSGKTTFLNALSDYIPKDERIITIEDSAELQIENVPNLVRLETRNANASGSGRVTIRELIKSSLRMRPERIIVGEVRGEEALDMLQAMNTGHDGSLSTGHANSSRGMLSRLETMVLEGSAELPLPAIRQQISSAVDIIIHLSRLRDHSRKTMEIVEVLDLDEHGVIQLNPLYRFVEDQDSTLTHVSGSLQRTENKMVNTIKLTLSGYSTEI